MSAADPKIAALVAFVTKMTGVDDPNWMTVDQAIKVTEGLKAWRKRAEAAAAVAPASSL